jgi:mRNA-degrading endonuclease RelE of RelBE toxin-antitoxin system
MAFTIDFSPRARDNLKGLRKRDQQIILDAIALQLSDQPDRPARNRKPLEENSLAPWELRAGDFRVFYDVDREEELVVIVAVGQKMHNVLRIGGEEIEL